MDCRIEGKWLIFTEHSTEELRWLKNILTWKDEKGEMKTLLFHNGVDFYTFSGLLNTLRQENSFEISLGYIHKEPRKRIDVSPNILENITLLDFQIEAIKKSIHFKKGILDLPTSSGKTEMILGLIRYLLQNNLISNGIIIVPYVGLADQLTERAYKRGFSKDEICYYNGRTKELDSTILVCVADTLYNLIKKKLSYVSNTEEINFTKFLNINFSKLDEEDSFYQRVIHTDLLISDECHHLQSNKFGLTHIAAKNPKYQLEYSGSPFRADKLLNSYEDCLTQGIGGNVIFKVSHQHLREVELPNGQIGLIAEPIIFFKPIGNKVLSFKASWNRIYNNFIVKHTARNQAIVDYTNRFIKNDLKTLIIVQRLDHAEILMSKLRHLKVICVFGGNIGKAFNEMGELETFTIDYNQFRKDFEDDRYDVVIGSPVMDEGFDLPSIGAVIIAVGQKSRIKILQRLGRGLRRKKTGPNRVYILDFNDKSHVYLFAQSKARLKLYREVDATIIEDEGLFNKYIYSHNL